MPTFYEFFAGGGMVRAGLGNGWRCLAANDFDPKKAASYAANWGDDHLIVGDINSLSADDLPGSPDLVWGSSPCQDLSLAGAGHGLSGERSGTYYALWRLIDQLDQQGRAPKLVAVENVVGALTSRDGDDFRAMVRAYVERGYRPGALVINADLFVPQSRPRLFLIGARGPIDPSFRTEVTTPFHSDALQRAAAALPDDLVSQMIWWRLPPPPLRNTGLAELVEDAPADAPWRNAAETENLLSLMAPLHRARVAEAQASGRRMVGTVYRRTRRDASGQRVQRAEVRFDNIAGCLRTPSGGSSRQTLLVVHGSEVRSRLVSARETARLMGLEDSYILPKRYNDAYHLTGDGVVAPVVRHLAEHLFEPLLSKRGAKRAA